MKLRRFFTAIFSIYGFLVFLLVMLLLFPFIIIASLFGEKTGGKLIYIICTAWSDICLFSWGISHKNINREQLNTSQPAIYIFNHRSYMDIPLLLVSLRSLDIRVLGKAEMTKIPIFGFIYRKAAITVKRTSSENRAKSLEQLIRMVKNKVSVVIAPEGTFNMTDEPLKFFYDGAFKIAIETKTPIRPFILPDSLQRLHYKSIFTLTPGKSRAIFLPEIPAGDPAFASVETLKQKAYHMMEAALEKYKPLS